MKLPTTSHHHHQSPAMDSSPPSPSSKSWSIYGREEITRRYEILDRVGSGAYSDVYRGSRRSDGLAVALKEVHDYQSAFREIEALQTLRGSPNVVQLFEYFWREDEDAVLVLEFLPLDLDAVVRAAKRDGGGGGIPGGEIKRWMMQILGGVDACHRSGIVHRDVKPLNLLVSAEGVLKLADFGQARILSEPRSIAIDGFPDEQGSGDERLPRETQELNPILEDDYLQELDNIKGNYAMGNTDKDPSLLDGETSCLATCNTSDVDDDPFYDPYSYESSEVAEGEYGSLTSCVGTRWYKAPELLYGSTNYGLEIDLWSMGCIFAELLCLQPLFPGESEIDQISKIINVLGDLNEESFPGCSKLPDYSKIFFRKVESPLGLSACLQNRSPAEVNLVGRLVRFDPASRATAMEMLSEKYFVEEPLPVPLTELRVPDEKDEHDESSFGEWGRYEDLGSDSDL